MPKKIRRRVIAQATQAVSGQKFSAIFDRPPVGTYWKVQQIRLEVPGYMSGALAASVFLDGRFVEGSNQGQADSTPDVGPDGSIAEVHAGSTLSITWDPTNVPGIVQGRATIAVMQVEGGG